METRFEVKSVHVGSGVLVDNVNAMGEGRIDGDAIYKLMNIMIKIKFPPIKNLLEKGPTKEEIADEIAQVIYNKIVEADVLDVRHKGDKIKNLTPFKRNEEVADDDKFGWYKVG